MSSSLLFLILAALTAVGYLGGRWRAASAAQGDARRLHSRTTYHGLAVGMGAFLAGAATYVLLSFATTFMPALAGSPVVTIAPLVLAIAVFVVVYLRITPEFRARNLVELMVLGLLISASLIAIFTTVAIVLSLVFETARFFSQYTWTEFFFGVVWSPAFQGNSQLGMLPLLWGTLYVSFIALLVAVPIGLFTAIYLTQYATTRLRRIIKPVIEVLAGIPTIVYGLFALITVAIVLSLVFETARFFSQYTWTEFFFGVVWSPAFQGNSQLGMLPLLWGTLYVSFIALLVAVPIGLFTAIYLTQYATTRLRKVIKPVIEVLAGIPTIVYGLFALITVGPVLRDYFAQPTGLGNSSASVMTAGLVMGIMLIPFVSSLSDDIINAVPRAMRDGSLALGSTQSETIRRVIIPAALPGIVGAILLAASRAVGETMIVVLGAGAAARMSLNPFEAMTTVTVKIVSQLTGDTDFSSPETLVAFALGITLFTMTLCMNVVALYIVRRYREQYE